MKVRFWGVRGSIASPNKNTIEYGANTSCIEIRGNQDEIIIIDSGTGIRELGNYLLLNDLKTKKYLNIHILFTHTHWDHIQGFPFFVPIYFKNVEVVLWAPLNIMGDSLKKIMQGQMNYNYFPINLSELNAKIYFEELKEESRYINSFYVETIYLNHPIICLGYRISYQGKTVVTMYDHEPYYNFFKVGSGNLILGDNLSLVIKENIEYLNQKFINFAKNADLLIIDSQYTKEEYIRKIGWGHSSIESSIAFGMQAHAKRIALFHHDPNRTDRELDIRQTLILEELKEKKDLTEIFFAKERLEVDIV